MLRSCNGNKMDNIIKEQWLGCSNYTILFIFLIINSIVFSTSSFSEVYESNISDDYSEQSHLNKQTVLSIPRLVANDLLNKYAITDPHWDRTQCNVCHNGKPSKNNLKLHIRDANKMCESCHQYIPVNLLNHSVSIKPNEKMLDRMPSGYKKTLQSKLVKKGTMSCLTCHDVLMQCTPSQFFNKGRNSEFFRAGPFRSRTDLCFKCHDKRKFKRFNPHQQISKTGTIKTSTCYVCHKEVDKLSSLKSSKELIFNVSDYSKMCTGCHVWRPHPGGELAFGFKKKKANHLVKASDLVLLQMKFKLDKEQAYFPLEPGTGKVHCATCHNVHEAGVINNKIKAKGADSEDKLRNKNMCILCHPI